LKFTVKELKREIRRVWNSIPQRDIDALVLGTTMACGGEYCALEQKKFSTKGEDDAGWAPAEQLLTLHYLSVTTSVVPASSDHMRCSLAWFLPDDLGWIRCCFD
jgi:hypothetical protein